MIEATVIKYLNESLKVQAYAEQPASKDSSFVLVERTSGGESNGLCSATIAIQSYATTLFEAAKLNEEVKTAMADIDDQKPISSAKLNNDYNFTDTTTKRYRYQAVYDLTYYKED